MNEYQAALDKTRIHSSRFDTAIEWLLVALLAFMPLAFGVVHAWSEEVVIVLSGAIVVCFVLKLLFHRSQKLIWSWAYVPIGLFLFVAVLQLIPLPVQLVSIISPNTATLKTELLGTLPEADRLLKSMSLSFYSNATKHDLRLVLAVVAVFVVVLNVFRRPDQIKRLLIAITVIGGVIAAITLAQNIFGNGKIYWFVPTYYGRAHSGPFVNHSNYGQFMNLSIGAALGWLCVKLHESFAGKKVTPAGIVEYLSSGSAKSLWLLMAVMGLCTASVFISLTRGGMVSMLIAMTFTTLLFVSRRSFRSHGWIMVVIALIAFTCVLYLGFDAVYDRLATLRDLDKAESGRLQILKDIWVAWTKFPIFGTGLGTHSVVYPMFDRSTITALAAHAENEYAQVAEETGLVGLGLLIIFGIIVWSSCARNIRNTKLPIRSAAYGLCFGILAILIHSLSDFGQHLPANAILSAIFCALLLALAQSRQNSLVPASNKRGTRAAQVFTSSRSSTVLRITFLFGVCLLWGWALTDANNARIAERHWQQALDIKKGLIKKSWRGTDTEYADLISQATTAVNYQPNNVIYRHWLNVYRWHSICQVTNPDSGEIIVTDDSMPTIRDIVAEFHKALTVCPTHGPTYSIVGQIEKLILNDDSGAERIRKGFRLAPCDPVACFVAGWLDVKEGKTQDCIAKFEKAVQLDGSLFGDVVDIYVNQLSRPHLAISVAGDDIGWLIHVANVLEDMQYSDLAEETREKIRGLLEAKCSEPGTPGSVFVHLGNIYSKQQNNEAAIECYRQALAREYSQVHWRLELAKLLIKIEEIPEAMTEAKICLRLRPQLKAAETLVADLSVHPAVLAEEIASP
jgi:tetratricopeptide (TPR) repeat protein